MTDTTFMKKLIGSYYSDRGDRIEFSWRAGKLYRRNVNFGSTVETKIVDEGRNRYKIPAGGSFVLTEKEKARDSIMEIDAETPTGKLHYKRQPKMPQAVTAEFAGKYFNVETETFYHISFSNGQLTMSHNKYPDAVLRNIAPDQFTNDANWWMNHIVFLRDKQKKVIGFEINSGRVLHLRFDKVP